MDEINNKILKENKDLSLKDLMRFLINNKLTIIIFTLVFSISFAIYEYTKPKFYKSSVSIVTSEFDNKRLQKYEDIKPIILFYFNEMIGIKHLGDKFITLSTSGKSVKKNEKILKEAVAFLIDDSKQKIHVNQKEMNLKLARVSQKVQELETELDRMNSLNIDIADVITKNQNQILAHNLRLEINTINYEKNALENKINDRKLFINTSQFGNINSSISNSIKNKNILAFAILGFITSIFFLFIKQTIVGLRKE
jgi:LPS O-antigen subunit length determinant protein (WzzB/FepE family)